MSPGSSAHVGGERNTLTAPKWPYVAGLCSLALGVLGLFLAPISGLTYLALPGVGMAAILALLYGCPARFGLVVSACAFLFGGVTLVLAVTALAGTDFFLQEWGFMTGLFALPLLGLLVGFPSAIVAIRRPGYREARLKRVGPLA